MSYEPTVWATGDVITSTKLNKLENGLAEASGGGGGGGTGVLVVNVDENSALDKTWQEIHDAPFAVLTYTNGSNIYVRDFLINTHGHGSNYYANFAEISENGTITVSLFAASSADGYPVYSE